VAETEALDFPHHAVIGADGDIDYIPLTAGELADQERRDREHAEQRQAVQTAHDARIAAIAASTDPAVRALAEHLGLIVQAARAGAGQ
jgi:hypothetical protein